MKILILTQPIINNYGGILQNYALQIVLKQHGHDVQTLDWYNEPNLFRTCLSFLSRLIKRYIFLNKKIETSFRKNNYGQRLRNNLASINYFIRKNIDKTQYYDSIKKVKKQSTFFENNFDTIIVGSDQVWIDYMVPFTFLDFMHESHINKIVYAASFGQDTLCFSEKKIKKCKKLIKKFNFVSVRENSGVQLCHDFFDQVVEKVCDPTLLLEKKDFLKILNKKYTYKNTIFCYILDMNDAKKKLIDEFAEILKMKVVYATVHDNLNIFRNERYLSIEDWLASIYYSKFTITDSFHGTIFSIIFNKQFLTVENNVRGATRFYSLLEPLGLCNRLVKECQLNNLDSHVILEEKINYETINDILNQQREESLLLLKQFL